MGGRKISRLSTWLIVGIPVLWILLFMLLPYGVLLTYSFWIKKYPLFVPAFQFGNYWTLISDPQYFHVLVRTLKIALLVSVSSLVLAYPFAYFLVFKLKNGSTRAILFMAIVAPLWVSYLLRAYIWKTILGTQGILNSFLLAVGLIDEPSDLFLYNQFAMVVTLTYIFIPFMVIPIFTALEKIPMNLIEASGDLGEGSFQTFLKIILPLSIPGIIAGFTITFCLSFGDFIAPFLVGGPDGSMISNVITSQFGAALNWPLGSALAVVMLVIVLAIVSLSDYLEQDDKVKL